MTDNVIKLVPNSVGENYHIDADEILSEAMGEFDTIVLVGTHKDGSLRIRMSDTFAEAAMMLACAHVKLVTTSYDTDA